MSDGEVEVNVDDNVVVEQIDSIAEHETDEMLHPRIRSAFDAISRSCGFMNYTLNANTVVCAGENAYGIIKSVELQSQDMMNGQRHWSIVKMAPKNEARRAHMRVSEFYIREVFMYETVFRAYRELGTGKQELGFDVIPEMYEASLEPPNEFIIVQDLTQLGYKQNSRVNLPTPDLVECSVVALAKLHAMSFVLQAKQPTKFTEIVGELSDNLFTNDIAPVTLEFGKKSLQRTRSMINADPMPEKTKLRTQRKRMLDVLQRVKNKFKKLALHCVDGKRIAPYAVICHGDFWNNNILYKYDSDGTTAIDAKLIDFQMSRYASPVLDLMHYFYACTERDLRQNHFLPILDIYYDTLTTHIARYELCGTDLYPREIYEQQLREFGIFGLIMAAYSLPFFIAEGSEVIDMDSVSEALAAADLSSDSHHEADVGTDSSDAEHDDDNEASRRFVEENDMLSERMKPIFKRRMMDIVRDVIKYEMDKTLNEIK